MNTTILETFRFDFTYKERDAEKLNSLFEKYGYPNLTVDLTNAYEGLWNVYDKKDRQNIWEEFHSGFVTFYKDDNNVVYVEFNHKDGCVNPTNAGSKTYFNKDVIMPKAKDSLEEMQDLKEKIRFLEEENEIYRRREEKIMELLKS